MSCATGIIQTMLRYVYKLSMHFYLIQPIQPLIILFYELDEIIRQVTINCAERGFLLSRIRDEIAMSIEAYETLYCSSAAFGIRKALQSQEGKEQLYAKVKDLEVVLCNPQFVLKLFMTYLQLESMCNNETRNNGYATFI